MKKQTKPAVRRSLWLVLLLLAIAFIAVQKGNSKVEPPEEVISIEVSTEDLWVDSVYNAMSEDQRLGQLFMIRAHSDKGPDHIQKVEATIKKYHVGGLCFFQGTPEKQAELCNRYQKLSKQLPLMVAMDAEWGLGMRMKNTSLSFPRQLTLGAVQDNRLIYEMGKEVALQLRRVGTHINFAPVADINNNAANPVINTRSFGEDRNNVAVKSYMYMKGMQDHGVMACAKHFPGHGDTDVDSHHDLPIIPHSRERLDSIELFPFQILADYGIGSFMVAHLNIPVFDERENRPTTLSRNMITNVLRKEMNYDGLVFTDALEMKGVTKYFDSGVVEAEALLAGNDILLLPEDMEASFREIKNYLSQNKLDHEQVEASVKRVLRAKYRLGLTKPQVLSEENVRAGVNDPKAKALKHRLIENALTLVRNPQRLIPFEEVNDLKMASLSIGVSKRTTFQDRLESYAKMTHHQSGKEISSSQQASLLKKLKDQDVVIVALHDMSSYASRKYGISSSTRQFIDKLKEETKVVLVVFGTPYSLQYFDELNWVLEAYEENEITQDLAAQALFGAIPIRGRLPVTASPKSRFNQGVITKKVWRLGFSIPERVGLIGDSLARIDEIAMNAIDSGATPGCVVLVAKEGKVVFHKSYGHFTYSRAQKVSPNAIYDLASITKIASATIAVMKMQEQGLVDIEKPLGAYLPELKGSNKEDLIIKDVMAHRAGLKSWIPFYKETVTQSRRNPQPLPDLYRRTKSSAYNIPVTDQLFLREDYVDTIWQRIITSELRTKTDYLYSDLGFYLVSRLVQERTGQSIDEYVDGAIYEPLGLQTATYNPWKEHALSMIPPTESDRYFRRQVVRGYVHDMGAAMLGGVSGHAGLFANATDLAILMQMLLQGGHYGGKKVLTPSTIRTFTTRFPGETRRGIGFDMLQTDRGESLNCSPHVSVSTYGHLGFTGTAVWVDPEHELIYVFLSNRTFPSMRNYKLGKMDIRPRIQTAVYKAMMEE